MAKIRPRTIHAVLAFVFVLWLQHVVLAQQSSASAQTNPAESTDLTIKKSVRQVILDVVVTDAHGKAIRGLSKNDFRITEDGTEQKPLSFEAHSLDVTTDLPNLPRLPANTFMNLPRTPERGPLYVLLLDLVNTEVEDQISARQQLLKFVRDKPDGTRFCVLVLSDGLHLTQGFTDDKKLLYAALDPNEPKKHIPRVFLYGRNYGHGDPLLVISALNSISEFMGGLPERKNLIWMAGGFPFIGTLDNEGLRGELKQTIAGTTQAQIALYPIDLQGVVVNRYASLGQSNIGTNLSFEYLQIDELAQSTGGQASYGLNDVKGALADVVQTGGHYYTLTYSPTNQNYDGALRKIKVELPSRDYKLSYRTYYFAVENAFPTPAIRTKKSDSVQPAAVRSVTDSLYANMHHGAPLAHDLIFRAQVRALGQPAPATAEQMENLSEQPAYFRVRRKDKPQSPLPPVPLQTYSIDYTLMPTKGEAQEPRFEIAAAAFDADGKMLNGVVHNATRDDSESRLSQQAPPNGKPKDKFYRMQESIDVPVGASSIRIAVRDTLTDRVGAMEIQLPLAPGS